MHALPVNLVLRGTTHTVVSQIVITPRHAVLSFGLLRNPLGRVSRPRSCLLLGDTTIALAFFKGNLRLHIVFFLFALFFLNEKLMQPSVLTAFFFSSSVALLSSTLTKGLPNAKFALIFSG